VLCTESDFTVTPAVAAVVMSAMVVSGPLVDSMRNTGASPSTRTTPGSERRRSAHPGGTAEKLASSVFSPGIAAFSLMGESSAINFP
jgi:hypothetical protein